MYFILNKVNKIVMNKLFKSSRQHILEFKNKFKVIVTLQNLNIVRLLDFTFEFKI